MDKSILKAISVPLLILSVAALLYFSWQLLGLPSDEALIGIARSYFERYGLITLLVSALLEGVLLVGVYYPGSLVIFLGVIFSIGNPIGTIQAVAVVIVGLFIAYCINYVLGKYGWYRLLLAFGLRKPLDEAQSRLTKYGLRAIFLTYWHPNLAALTATATGILQFPFATFCMYSLSATILWNTFWGVLVYNLGETSLHLMGMPFILSFVSLWIVFVLIKAIRDRHIATPPPSGTQSSTN